MEKTVLIAGNVRMDVLLNVPYAPHDGRFVNSKDRYMFTTGGSGAYTAVAARRVGAPSLLCTCIGDDQQGQQILEHLKTEDVDTAYIATDKDAQTGLEVYLLEQYGVGGRIRYNGANAKLSCENIEYAFERYPYLFVANTELDTKVLRCAADCTRVQNIPFVLDTDSVTDRSRIAGLMGVDILIASEESAERLTGVRPSSTDNCLRACIALCDLLPLKFVVLKLGRRGAYIYDGTYCELLMAPSLEVVDPTGEHECFVGAFCAHFVENMDVLYATKFALAASAICASRVGGCSSFPVADEINGLL